MSRKAPKISISLDPPFSDYHKDNWHVVRVLSRAHLEALITRYTWSPIIWEGGSREGRLFKVSHFCGVDVDDHYTLKEAVEFLDEQGCFYIVAPTRHHGLPKGTEPPRDRYRVVMLWSTPITDRTHYKQNVSRLVDAWKGDKKCKDAARLFYPSREIAKSAPGAPQAVFPFVPELPFKKTTPMERYGAQTLGRLPFWVKAFLAEGRLCSSGGRNNTVLWVSAKLLALGFSESQIIDLVQKAPFSREGFSDSELVRTVAQGCKYQF